MTTNIDTRDDDYPQPGMDTHALSRLKLPKGYKIADEKQAMREIDRADGMIALESK